VHTSLAVTTSPAVGPALAGGDRSEALADDRRRSGTGMLSEKSPTRRLADSGGQPPHVFHVKPGREAAHAPNRSGRAAARFTWNIGRSRVLDLGPVSKQAGAVSDAESLTSRSAGIFERLRAAADEGAAEPPDQTNPPGAVPGEDTQPAGGVEPGSEPAGPAESEPDASPPAVEEPEPAAAPVVARPVQMPPDALVAGGLPGADRLPELKEPAVSVEDGPGAERRDAAGNRLPRVMAVANQKGGVGKTTTAVNLAAALADAGYRTLVVDLDPQGNASTGLGINIRDLQLSMYDVIIHEASIDDTIEATAMKNLFVAPSSLDLAGAEIELVPAFSRELRLRHALQEVEDDYDYVLIDCPPSLGLLTVNGLAAAAEVLVPIQCEYYALEGLGQLLRNVSLVQRNLNPTLAVSTFVCVMYDARTKLADQVVTEVREHFGEKVCRIVIPRTVRLSEAPSYGQPILAFDPRSRGAIAYRELAREVSGGRAPGTGEDGSNP
jgi:chromosome partitioning protein